MAVDIVSSKKSRLKGIDALRCIAFLMVFISHCGIGLPIGECGVSLFLVISGFVTVYSNLNREPAFSPGFKSNLKFAIKKIKGLYILHVVCTLLMTIKLLIGGNISLGLIVVKFILNLLLIQEWFPLANASINGVSWYLCVILLFYFLYPWVDSFFRKYMDTRKAKIDIVFLITLMFVISFGSRLILGDIDLGNSTVFRSNLCHWLVYYFPPVRLIEILIGCNLALVYLNAENNENDILKWTIYELVTIIALIVVNCLYLNYIELPTIGIFNPSEIWWKDSLVYVLPSIISVFVFARNRGIVTRPLNNGLTSYISNMSRNGFLIHFVVIQYIDSVIERVDTLSVFAENNILKVLLYALVTAISCEIWKHAVNNRERKKGTI